MEQGLKKSIHFAVICLAATISYGCGSSNNSASSAPAMYTGHIDAAKISLANTSELINNAFHQTRYISLAQRSEKHLTVNQAVGSLLAKETTDHKLLSVSVDKAEACAKRGSRYITSELSGDIHILLSHCNEHGFTTDGTLYADAGFSANSLHLDLLAEDNATGQQFKLENLEIYKTNLSAGGYALEMRGRLYNSDLGYVDISSDPHNPPYYADDGAPFPSGGQIYLTGANGRISVFAISSTQVQVQLASESVTNDEYTEIHTWSDIENLSDFSPH